MPANALRAALRLAAKVLALVVLLGGSAATAATVPVHGRVENERGQPLRDAVVRLYPMIGIRAAAELQLAGTFPPPPKVEAKVDADGSFTVEAPGPGLWRLVASAPGRAELETVLHPLVEETWLPAAALPADAPLEVSVFDAAGKPVPGAVVVADQDLTNRFMAFMADWTPVSSRPLTDANGKAVLHRAASKRVDLTVAATGHASMQMKGVGGSNARVALVAGTARELRVVGPDGRPVEGAMVLALPAYAPLGSSDRAGKVAVATTGPAPLSLVIEDRAGASARISLEPPPKGDAARAAAERAVDVRLERPLTLSGRVIDTDSRQPIAGAVVYGQRAESWTVTDSGGAYTLERLAPKRTGWIFGAAVAHLPGNVDGSDAAAGRAPTLALRPAAALVGSVADPRGKPLAGVTVSAAPSPDMAGGRFVFRRMGMGMDRLQTKTDERGRYRLAPLAVDMPQQVTFRLAGFATLEKKLPPAPRDRLAELHVMLQTGTRGIGRVVTVQGTAIAGAKVSLDRQEEGGPGMRMMRFAGQREDKKTEAESDAAGKFTIADLATGKFVLKVEASGYAATTVPGIEVPANVGEVDLGTVKLAPGAVIEGHVVGPHGEPIEGAEVFALEGMMGMMPQVRWALMGKEPDATSAADGFFRLGDHAPGEKVSLAVRHAGYTVERLNGVTAPTDEPVTVTLRPSSAVRGRIVDDDGDPVADAMVRLTVERAGGGMAFSMISGNSGSGDDGRFAIEDVEPGTVRLTVTAAGFLPLERGGLEVPAGKDLEGLELVLHSGATVEGRVSTPDGGPAIGASVELVEEGGGTPFMPARMMGGGARAETDGDGHYRLEGVEPGARTLAAEHEDFDRGVGSLDVKPGENHLDLRLGGGQTVSGRVTSSQGGPVAGATVTLGPPGQPWGAERSATTDEGGLFNVTGVPDGTYEATASHADFAEGRAASPITVAGAPVGGVSIELPAGAAVVGALHGLSLAELSRTRVTASNEQSFQQGTVSYDGRYRIGGLAPGEWTVVGRLDEGGRQARGRVTIAAGDPEETLDLDFEGGLALSGHVRQDGRPVDGAVVMVRGNDVVGNGSGRSDYTGAYKIENLRPGSYNVEVFSTATGMRKHDTVNLDGDRELDFDLRSTRIAGKVLEAGTGEPLAGVAVKAEPAQPDDEGMAIFSGAVTTDDGGRFALGAATEGAWTVSAEKAGYARASKSLDVGADPVDDLEIRLSPTQGITLQVSRTAGAPPAHVQVAVLDGARRPLVTGMYSTGENGRVRLSTVPPGTWEVLVRTDDSGTVRVIASSPGEPVPVVLAPQATLQVNVPALAGEPTRAVVTLTGGDGQRFLFPGWSSVEEHEILAYGRVTYQFLPAGTWTIEAKAPDGRTWTGTATTTAGAATTVDLD